MKKVFLIVLLAFFGGIIVGVFIFDQKKEVINFRNSVSIKEQSESVLSATSSVGFSLGTSTLNNFQGLAGERTSTLRALSLEINQTVSSPVVVEGIAPVDWFAEGRFPVQILDNQERIIGLGVARAKEQEIESGSVAFIATVDFNASESPGGFILFKKSAAVGEDQTKKREEVRIPVQFAPVVLGRELGGCHVTGCSSQVCSDQDVITDCLYKEEYICYQKAKCERQSDGACGWAKTKELQLCLDQFNE